MKKKLVNFLLLFLIGICGCNVYTVTSSYYDRSVDFAKYSTFAWLPDSGVTARQDSFRNSAYDNDIIRNNAKNYVVHNLSTKGYRVDVDAPDMLVQLVLFNEKKERRMVDYPPPPPPYYYYRNRFYYPFYYPYYDYYTYYGWGCRNNYCDYVPVYKQTYVKGTISINVYDRKQKKLIWSASAEGDLYDPSYIQDHVHPAIRKILKDFPAKQKVRNNNHSADIL